MIDSDDVMLRAADLRETLDELVYRIRIEDAGVGSTFYDRWQALYDDMGRMQAKLADLSTLPPPPPEPIERYTPIYI